MDVGSQLNQYRVTGTLGAGGMGEVYRAEDTRLKRDVAIKMLPAEVAGDPERRARMEREAQLLAALNHPNIAAIHGLEMAMTPEGTEIHFLAMELVEGENLSDRLSAGPLSVERAVDFALQIAAGLEAAHEKGIVHRDLKPSNVQITPDGRAKVLDFGLAKAYEADGNASSLSPELTASPTVLAATQTGVILGTAAYMSPEQARGKAIDKRTDIWAFGCVLFEMLAARKPFDGETITDVIAAIVRAEPDLDKLPPGTPMRLRTLLERCLTKDPRERMRDIGDARIELEHVRDDPGGATVDSDAGSGRISWRTVAAGVAAGLVAGALFGYLLRPVSAPRPVYVDLATSANPINDVAVAPDGRGVVYRSRDDAGRGLYWREFGSSEATLLPGTERGVAPAFGGDPDTFYFADGSELKRGSLTGGSPVTVARTEQDFLSYLAYGGESDVYVTAFKRDAPPLLLHIDVRDGSITTLPEFEADRLPFLVSQSLPGGAGLLGQQPMAADSRSLDRVKVAVMNPADGAVTTVIEGYGAPWYDDASGQLLFVDAEGRLLTVAFDLATRRISGAPVPRIEGLRTNGWTADYSLGADGSVVYVAGERGNSSREFVWRGRDGQQSVVTEKQAFYDIDSRLSPDGRLIAAERSGEDQGIWIHDVARDTQIPLWPGSDAGFPVFSPDGRLVAASEREGEGGGGLFLYTVDRSGEPTRLTTAEEGTFHLAMDWALDGTTILFLKSPNYFRNQGADIWTVPADGSGDPQPLLTTPAHEVDPRFSPDGRWVAYQSDQSGSPEVYIRSATGGGGEVPISPDGGFEPLWNPAGGELFFRSGSGELMVVDVETDGPELVAGVPRPLFSFPPGFLPRISEPDPTGERFLMVRTVGAQGELRLAGYLNWRATLAR